MCPSNSTHLKTGKSTASRGKPLTRPPERREEEGTRQGPRGRGVKSHSEISLRSDGLLNSLNHQRDENENLPL